MKITIKLAITQLQLCEMRVGQFFELLIHVNSSTMFKGPILHCFSSISHSCQRFNNIAFDMHCPKPICGPEFQMSKRRSSQLYWEQAVYVPAPLNANEFHLSNLPYLQHTPLRERMPLTLVVACANVFQWMTTKLHPNIINNKLASNAIA